MRTASFVFTPMAALALAITPLSAQVRASVHIDIPILGTHRPVIVDRDDRYDDRRYIVEVRDYSSRNYGQWKKEYRNWRPVTIYVFNGRYYERPVPPKEKAERDDRQPGPRIVKLVSFSKSGNHRATVKKVQVFGNERVTPGGTIKRAKRRLTSVKKQAGD